MLAALLSITQAVAAVGGANSGPRANSGPHTIRHTAKSFVCNKKAFYPTVPGGAGVRQLLLPGSYCEEMADVNEILERLCCANTHVRCTDNVSEPVLISYDGANYAMPGDRTKVLGAAYGRLCSMPMADKCGDCKQNTCALFTPAPESKSCYGLTFTDHADGSGFPNGTDGTAVAPVPTTLRGRPVSATTLQETAELPLPQCRPVQPVMTLNTTEYLRASWYIQQQQLTGYQPANALFCVAQTFGDAAGHKVPFYSGKVISVYNYATSGAVNGPPVNTQNETILCARQTNEKDPARLINAPCFLPNILAGDYWVVGAGPSAERYEWAIVSAGTPTVQYPDGCTTKLTGTNGAGLWLFSRKPVADVADIATMRTMLSNMGYTLSQLLPVAQDKCTYDGAYIKPDVYAGP